MLRMSVHCIIQRSFNVIQFVNFFAYLPSFHIMLRINWLRGKDSNLRPLGYEPNSLAADVPRDICYISYT